MSNFILSPAARADIDGIWDYTTDTWSFRQADQYTSQILRACASISSDGREGRPIPEVREGYRKLSVGSHFIIYRLIDGKVDIVRILHLRMDIALHLED